MRRVRAVISVFAIVLITCVMSSQTGLAYDVTKSPWRDTSVLTDLRVDASDLHDTNQLTLSQWLGALSGAIQIWNDAAAAEQLPVHMRVVDGDPDAEIYIQLTDSNYIQFRRLDGTSAIVPHPVCGANVFDTVNDCAGLLGTTFRYGCTDSDCSTRDGEPVDRATIVVPVTRPWQVLDRPTSVPSDAVDVETMFLHELGHALGLNHSPKWWLNQDCSSVMVGVDGDPCTIARTAAGAGAFVRRELSEDDICGLRTLYGTACLGAIRGLVVDQKWRCRSGRERRTGCRGRRHGDRPDGSARVLPV